MGARRGSRSAADGIGNSGGAHLVSDRPLPVGSLLRSAPPDRLAEVTAAHLRETFGADRVEVLLADLTMNALHPVLDPEGELGGPLEQRCFGSQRPVVDSGPGRLTRVLLPLTSWGDRAGVLRIDVALIARNGEVRPVQLDQQLPLGMFDDGR
jgi:hypothetical protein